MLDNQNCGLAFPHIIIKKEEWMFGVHHFKKEIGLVRVVATSMNMDSCWLS